MKTKHSRLLIFLAALEAIIVFAALYIMFYCDFNTLSQFASCMIMQRVYMVLLAIAGTLIGIAISFVYQAMGKNSKHQGG